MKELSGMEGPLKGVGFQPQVDPPYRRAGPERLLQKSPELPFKTLSLPFQCLVPLQ